MKKPKLLKCAYYVSMTDKALSGWGMAQGKRARYIACASNYEEAEIVKENAINRGDQKNITISRTAPRLSTGDRIGFMNKSNNPTWYKKHGFTGKQK